MAKSAYNYLEDFVREIEGYKKTANQKSAEPISEPGGYDGGSAHPSAKVDDGLIPGRTGFRAAENSADVKETGVKPTVDATPDAKPGGDGQGKVQLNIGVTQSAVGEEPSVEDDYKGTKDDPGTTHPMKADDGQKYAEFRALPLTALMSKTASLGDELLADFAAGRFGSSSTATAQPKTASKEVQAAATAGYEAAVRAGDRPVHTPASMIEGTIKEASVAAELLIDYLNEQATLYEKMAGGPGGMAGDDPALAGGESPAEEASEHGVPDGDEGAPPASMPSNPLAGAAAGGPAMDAPVSEGGAPVSDQESVHELASAMMEMGIQPEVLLQVAQQMASAPEGGAPPAADVVKTAQELWSAAHVVDQYRRSGKFAFEAPHNKRAREIRASIRSNLAEILNAGN